MPYWDKTMNYQQVCSPRCKKLKIIYKALSNSTTEEELRSHLAQEPLFTLDYADFIDEKSFTRAHADSKDVRAIVAGWINGVRLIDNMAMEVRS